MHPYQTAPPAQRPRRRRTAALWLPAVGVVAALAATLVYLTTGDGGATTVRPDGTADRFYAAVNAHDQATWATFLCDPSAATRLTNFKNVSLMNAPGPSTSGGSATAKGQFRLTTDVFLKQFRDYDFTVTLTRTGGRWCVAHVQSTPSKEGGGPSPFPISSTLPTPSPTAPTSAPSALSSVPNATPSSTGGASGSCHLPATASTSPAPVPPTVLNAGLSGRFAAPTLTWTLKTVSSFCYDGVGQSDLSGLLSYLSGAFHAQPDTKPNQRQFTSTSTSVKPAHTFVTINGTLKLNSTLDDQGTGSVEVDWY